MFYDDTKLGKAEEQANAWLSDNDSSFEIIDIKYQVTSDGYDNLMIIYRKK